MQYNALNMSNLERRNIFMLCEEYSNAIWTQFTQEEQNLKIIRGSQKAETDEGYF